MLKNKCCFYVIISIRFFSITICNLLIESPLYVYVCVKFGLPQSSEDTIRIWMKEATGRCKTT